MSAARRARSRQPSSTSSPRPTTPFCGAGHAQGRDDADRRGAGRGLYAASVSRIVSGGSAANTIVGVASFGVSGALSARSRATSSARSSATTCAPPASIRHAPGRGRPGDRPLLRLVTPDGERTMNTFLGASCISRRPMSTRRWSAAPHRLSRRLYVGPAGGQGGVSQGRPHRARGGRPRRADAVGPLLRRPLPRRVHRPHATRRVDTVFANTDEALSLYQTPSFDEALDAFGARASRGGDALGEGLGHRRGEGTRTKCRPSRSRGSSTPRARAICSPPAFSPVSRAARSSMLRARWRRWRRARSSSTSARGRKTSLKALAASPRLHVRSFRMRTLPADSLARRTARL